MKKEQRLRTIIKYFLLDFLWNLIYMFVGFFLVNLFYSIAIGKRVEFIYPLSLYGFVVCLSGIHYGVRYVRLYRAVEQIHSYDDGRIKLQGKLEEHMINEVHQLHREYIEQIHATRLEEEKKKRFLSMLIHNMKTPVTVNDVLIQRMSRGEIELQDGMEQLKQENDRLLQNLNQTLDVMRLQEFQKDYRPEPIDLITELRRIVNENKKQFIYQKVYPKIDTNLEQAVVLSDQKWNRLMIEQIISNAIKYSYEKHTDKKRIDEKDEKHIELEKTENTVELHIDTGTTEDKVEVHTELNQIKDHTERSINSMKMICSEMVDNAQVDDGAGLEEPTLKYIHFIIEPYGHQIRLIIRDEGIGIPSYDLDKVFDPFFTGENGRKGYSSSGIGLYFCKEAAESLGHTIEIQSKQGEGTSVILTYLAKL